MIEIVLAVAGPQVNTSGIVEWVVRLIIPLILLFIGMKIISNSQRGRFSENMGTLSNTIIGLMVIGGAALLFTFANAFVHFAFS